MRRAGWRVAASCAVLGLSSMTMGCAAQPQGPVAAAQPVPPAEPPARTVMTETGARQFGRASYYASHFTGRRTASGTRFDPSRATVAHRTLPFGTVVRITNLDNGRTETATVEDRGPFIPGRILDISRSVAERLDMIRSGVARVEVTPVEVTTERAAPVQTAPGRTAPTHVALMPVAPLRLASAQQPPVPLGPPRPSSIPSAPMWLASEAATFPSSPAEMAIGRTGSMRLISTRTPVRATSGRATRRRS